MAGGVLCNELTPLMGDISFSIMAIIVCLFIGQICTCLIYCSISGE